MSPAAQRGFLEALTGLVATARTAPEFVVTCPTCGGEAQWEESDPAPDDPYYAIARRCDECDGGGVVILDEPDPDIDPDAVCPECDDGGLIFERRAGCVEELPCPTCRLSDYAAAMMDPEHQHWLRELDL